MTLCVTTALRITADQIRKRVPRNPQDDGEIHSVFGTDGRAVRTRDAAPLREAS